MPLKANLQEAPLATAIVESNGVVAITYNALPGWYQWMVSRHIARRAMCGERDVKRAVATAIEAVDDAATAHTQDDAYGAVLAAAVDRLRRHDPWALFHDDLGDECTPFLVSEVVERAEQHGLRYLGEALTSDWWPWHLPSTMAERLQRDLADPVERQQAADLVSGASFKATLFVPEAAQPSSEVAPLEALDFALGPALSETATEPRGTDPGMEALHGAIAAGTSAALVRPLREAAEDANLQPEKAAEAALGLVARGQATFRCNPPPAVVGRPGERPIASPLARAQVRHSTVLSTLVHTRAGVDEVVVRALITLLDGSRGRDELVSDLVRVGPEWGVDIDRAIMDVMLDSVLNKLAASGLLEA